ncbi:hypothetical protein PAMP_000371 [Pampus punctatissimus]
MDSYSQRFESTTGRDSKSHKKKGFSHHGTSSYDEGDRKPKFLDRFASIRIPGSKKERPPLSHSKHNTADWSISSSSTSHHFEELSSKITSEKEILALFEKMMEDMNLNEEKKTPLRDKDLSTKREMVIQYVFTASKTGSLRSSHQISPQEFLGELKSGVMDERLFACLDSLRVSLTSNPVRQEKLDKKNQHKVVQCLKAVMNNKYGLDRILGEEKSLALLARAIDPTQPAMMTDVVKLLSAICIVGEENILEKVLEAITTAGEWRAIERFSPIVQGLRDRSVQLQVACMQLINALVTSPDELDFRLHIRNEFIRCGLKEILPFDEEFLSRQEAQAQLVKCEEKVTELQAELQAFRNQFGAVPVSLSSAHVGQASSSSGPPPCATASGVPPPPPPPPPPPLPSCPAPPPPPGVPPPFGAPPPPPLGFGGGLGSPTHHVLPYGLRPKKDFKPENSMKRLNWSKIRPQEMSESCFWVQADEDRYAKPELLSKVALTFGSQRAAKKEEEDLEDKKSIKKRIKQLKVLDPKIAQNLSIFLGSFRMPYQEIRQMILEVDEEQLTEPMIQNLVKHLPEQEQLNALTKYKNEYANLSEPEQFGVVMSSVKRLRPRLSHILFRLQFEEQVNNLRPDILAVNTACDEVRKSRSFGRLLELVLLLGNYMNAGSRNAQSYGFDLSSLCKLKDTKSADQKTTLLNFLAQVCEEDFPDVIKFVEDLEHVDRASRVPLTDISVSAYHQREGRGTEKSRGKENEDRYIAKRVKMWLLQTSFSKDAREQYGKLVIIHSNMETLYQNVLEYFAVDPKKTSVEELFTDLSNFRSMFTQALKENLRQRELEEKQRRAQAAKEKAEREKQERQQKKRRLLEVNAVVETNLDAEERWFCSEICGASLLFVMMKSYAYMSQRRSAILAHTGQGRHEITSTRRSAPARTARFSNLLTMDHLTHTEYVRLFSNRSSNQIIMRSRKYCMINYIKDSEASVVYNPLRLVSVAVVRGKISVYNVEIINKVHFASRKEMENHLFYLVVCEVMRLKDSSEVRVATNKGTKLSSCHMNMDLPSRSSAHILMMKSTIYSDLLTSTTYNSEHRSDLSLCSTVCLENNRAPLQRSRSRQNINVGSVVVKAPPAKEAHNESAGHPSAAARAKAAACSESGRRYKNTPGHSYVLDRERAVERETVKLTANEMRVEAEPQAFHPSSAGATVSSCSTNGESDVEALLAKLRAL